MSEQTPIADPWATRNEDGTIALHWPDGTSYALCSRELIEQMVDHHNKLVPMLSESTTAWWEYEEGHRYTGACGCGYDVHKCGSPRINEIRRNVGLAPIE